jgi:hypothetical protein
VAAPVVGFTVITCCPTDWVVTEVATSVGLETPKISGAAGLANGAATGTGIGVAAVGGAGDKAESGGGDQEGAKR